MKHDGTDLFNQVTEGQWPGFSRQADGGVITLINDENGERIQARTTAKGRYMIHKVGSPEPPLSFGAQLGNGNLKPNIQTKLARWGIETRPERQQQAAKQARQDSAEEPDTLSGPTTSTATTTEVEDMTRAADEILSDTSFAIELIAARVLELAKADGATKIEERGAICYDWAGDLYEVLHHLWPALPEEPDPADVQRLYMALIPPMRQSGILRQNKDAAGQETVWRVRDDNKPAAAQPVAPIATSKEEAAMTPAPATVKPAAPAPLTLTPLSRRPAATPAHSTQRPQETEGDVKIRKCDECAFADASQYAVQMHINKFAARPEDHPRDAVGLPCPQECGSVRIDPFALRKHCVEGHEEIYKGKTMCQKVDCLQWFDTHALYRAHLSEAHPEALRRTDRRPAVTKEEETVPPTPEPARKTAVTKTAVARVPAVAAEVQPAAAKTPAPAVRVAAANGAAVADETVAQAAYRMILEHGQQQEIIETLRAENDLLRKETMDLRMQVKEKDRTLKNFKKKLDALFEE